MMIARWSIDARFGHKTFVIDQMRAWIENVGDRIGWTRDKVRLQTGSVGALESTVQMEGVIQDLAELHEAWSRLDSVLEHKKWGREMEPHVISGTPRWEIFRVID